MQIFVNGRFLAQPVSGVQRYARELLTALDHRLSADPDLAQSLGPVTVLHPKGVNGPQRPGWTKIRLAELGGRTGHLWEQINLVRASRGGCLLSLCGAGPLTVRRQLLVIHDANVFVSPEGFTRRYRAFHRIMRPLLAAHVACLASVSRTAARELAPYLGQEEAAIRVIPNSADHILTVSPDPSTLHRFGLGHGRYILTVGNQSPNKNLARLAAAHAQTDAPLLVVAGGTAPGLATSSIPDGPRIRHIGRVNDSELRSLYEGASGFVWPALREGFGIPPLEAMALGIPVASSQSTAMPEVLGQAPIYFDPLSTEDIARAIRQLIGLTDEQRALMIRAGRDRAARFGREQGVNSLLDALAVVRAAPSP
jgi:glycosyltransferase involved in cell wall biosynthesis